MSSSVAYGNVNLHVCLYSPSGSTVSPTSTPPSNTVIPPVKAKSHAGAIAGGIVGGVVLLLILTGIFLVLRRRHQQLSEHRVREMMETQPVPFVSTGDNLQAPPTVVSELATSTLSSSSALPSKLRLSQPASPGTDTYTTVPDHDFYILPAASADALGPGISTPSHDRLPLAATEDREGTIDLAAVPALLGRLNNILARLPQSEAGAPPRYQD